MDQFLINKIKVTESVYLSQLWKFLYPKLISGVFKLWMLCRIGLALACATLMIYKRKNSNF